LGNIQQGRGGCIKCGIQKRSDGRRLDEQKTVRAMLRKGLKPLEPDRKASTKWMCK
jgi:hypothetical protein